MPRAAVLAFLAVSAGAGAAAPADRAQLARGEAVYARCQACHAIEGNGVGPQHCGLFGRRAGSAPGFDGYSPAMKASGIAWNARALDRFLADPMRALPGTAMTFAGVPDARERADLIAWLRAATQPSSNCTVEP